jgi:hypothetical protein
LLGHHLHIEDEFDQLLYLRVKGGGGLLLPFLLLDFLLLRILFVIHLDQSIGFPYLLVQFLVVLLDGNVLVLVGLLG